MDRSTLTRLLLTSMLCLACACGGTMSGGDNGNGSVDDDMMMDDTRGGDDDTGGTSMPADENFVGGVTADFFETAGSALVPDLFAAGATFISADGEGPDIDVAVNTKEIASCIITTTSLTTIPDIPDLSGISLRTFDAGKSGAITNGSAMADLTKAVQDSSTYVGPIDLLDRGFAPGDMIDFSFPGGADIQAFTTSITVPERFEVSAPDLDDPNLAIDFDSALDFRWNAAGAGQVTISLSTASATTAVSASCEFEDEGSATIPREVMECLLDDSTTTTVSLGRTNLGQVRVNLTGGGTGTVVLTGATAITRSIIDLMLEFDPCDFILCPEGQSCNPQSFVCE